MGIGVEHSFIQRVAVRSRWTRQWLRMPGTDVTTWRTLLPCATARDGESPAEGSERPDEANGSRRGWHAAKLPRFCR